MGEESKTIPSTSISSTMALIFSSIASNLCTSSCCAAMSGFSSSNFLYKLFISFDQRKLNWSNTNKSQSTWFCIPVIYKEITKCLSLTLFILKMFLFQDYNWSFSISPCIEVSICCLILIILSLVETASWKVFFIFSSHHLTFDVISIIFWATVETAFWTSTIDGERTTLGSAKVTPTWNFK